VLLANNLTSTTLIFPGQRLLIPGTDAAPALQDLPAPLSALEIRPLPPEVGRSIQIRATASQPVTLSGTFIDRPLRFSLEPDGVSYDAFYGVHALTVPGLYPLTLTVQDAAGSIASLTVQVRVVSGGYTNEVITLPAEQDDLLDPAVDEAEHTLVGQIMSGYTAQRYFGGPMGLPAAAPVTSPFGTRRSYNGGPYDRFHTGTDFGGPPGSPIYAPAPGVVVFSDRLQVRGLTTIIDHGWGVYTGYWHQAESYVEVGQSVNTGDVLGTIGSTGRSTGAHLHWEMWVNGVEVDPLQWTRLAFP
jgi:murein DD-endopeptidase MepM/ murein hydrolase activator NlpD